MKPAGEDACAPAEGAQLSLSQLLKGDDHYHRFSRSPTFQLARHYHANCNYRDQYNAVSRRRPQVEASQLSCDRNRYRPVRRNKTSTEATYSPSAITKANSVPATAPQTSGSVTRVNLVRHVRQANLPLHPALDRVVPCSPGNALTTNGMNLRNKRPAGSRTFRPGQTIQAANSVVHKLQQLPPPLPFPVTPRAKPPATKSSASNVR